MSTQQQLSGLGRLIASKFRPAMMVDAPRDAVPMSNVIQFLQQHGRTADADALSIIMRQHPGFQLPPSVLQQLGESIINERRVQGGAQLPLQGEGFAAGGSIPHYKGGGSHRPAKISDAMKGMAGMYGSWGRGALSTLLGLGGDLTRLGYTLTGNEEPARGEAFLPDSSDMRRRLPNLPEDMRQPTYEALGTYDPFLPTASPKILGGAARGAKGAISKVVEELSSHPSNSRSAQKGVLDAAEDPQSSAAAWYEDEQATPTQHQSSWYD